MYKITGIKQDSKGLILGYAVNDGIKEELLPVTFVYWLVKAGLISNATAKIEGEQLIVEVNTKDITNNISSEIQIKTEKIYKAIRNLVKDCRFNLNTENCTVKIVGCAYKHILQGTIPYKEMLVDRKNTLEIIGYEIKNTGNNMVYLYTAKPNTTSSGRTVYQNSELSILKPGDTVLLSTYETKLLLANENVSCLNGYLVYDINGVDLEPTIFDIDDDILVETTQNLERRMRFDHYPTSVLNRILTPTELKEQLKHIETIIQN